MRKSDKLKNFKKINLIVENRYLQSKGFILESFHQADGTPIPVDKNHMPLKISEAVGTDLEYITFSVNGESYRPYKVINKEQVSNGLTIKFGLESYKDGNWVPVGGMLTYYFDMDTRTDKLLFTDGRFENTIDAKKDIDSRYGLYEKIKQYVETRI
jgi:hypothetical protein